MKMKILDLLSYTSLVSLLVCVNLTFSEVCYITPSQNISCPQSPCFTLSNLFASSTIRYGNDTNVTLVFLSGNHTLEGMLSFANLVVFSMTKDIKDNEIVFIECPSLSGKLDVSETSVASINSLNFIGCGGNRFSQLQVEQLIVEDTIFQYIEGRERALVLNLVGDAIIVFLSNIILCHNACEDLEYNTVHFQDIISYFSHEQNVSNLLMSGGVLFVINSNVWIIHSKFSHNTAGVGGVLVAHNSKLHVVRSWSTFNYNIAKLGGVLLTSECVATVDDSSFGNNEAESFGGVMTTYKGSIIINAASLTNNIAKVDGGVVYAYESSLSITGSTFSDNRAVENCGAICIIMSSVEIDNSSFTNNIGSNGGVLFV